MADLFLTPSEAAQKLSGMLHLTQNLHVEVASPSAADIFEATCLEKCHLRSVIMQAGTTGSTGTTTLQVKKNGTNVGTAFSLAPTVADDTPVVGAQGVDFDEGDRITFELTAVATTVANLRVDAGLYRDFS